MEQQAVQIFSSLLANTENMTEQQVVRISNLLLIFAEKNMEIASEQQAMHIGKQNTVKLCYSRVINSLNDKMTRMPVNYGDHLVTFAPPTM